MKKVLYIFSLLSLAVLFYGQAHAHFAMILPSDDIVSKSDSKRLSLQVSFLHPFEGQYMEMALPEDFGVLFHGKKTSLLRSLKKNKKRGATVWQTSYKIKRPGDYIFYVMPAPYWEPAEETFIIHYTKVIVNALGLEEGWDTEVGLPVEIVPLTRPYGLWAGNVFQAVVKVNGKPLPFAEVEVEYYNEKGRVTAPEEPYITQVIKADSNGVFTYAMPLDGWWGFAALVTAPYKLKRDGREYPVELGGVIWIRTRSMQ